MNFQVVECDFIRRTLKVIDQYDEFVMPSIAEDQQFEVSLLINCLTGLLVLPFEHQKRMQKGARFPIICDDDHKPYKQLNEEWGLKNIELLGLR